VTLAYTFDNANRITGISDSSNSALTWTYGYDVLDRLTSASTTANSYGWTYDANGNRTAQTTTGATTFNVSTTSNRLTSTSGTLARTYSYDADGHTGGYGSLTFSYNNRGRMSSTSGSSTSYLYNAIGQMYEKSGSGGTEYLMYDEAAHLIGEYNSSGGLIEETVWLGDIPVAVLTPNGSSVNIYYIHSDHLNTPKKVAQPTTHTLAWRWDADPFGTASPNQNPGGLGTFVYNLRFPGQYYQSETGTNYNYQRDYDPLAGRYLESDLIGLKGGIDTYTYTFDSPAMWTDSIGLAPQCDEVARCKQVKEDGIKVCSDATLPTRDFGFSFHRCLNQYLEDHDCGPGGTPLPERVPQPMAPPSPRTQSNQPSSSQTANTLAAILAALFLSPIVACVLYAAVAAMWFIPDRRIEKKVAEET